MPESTWIVGLVLAGVLIVAVLLVARFRRGLAEEVAAREAALAAQRRFQQLVDNVDAVVWEGDPETYRVSFVNSGAERAFGYPVSAWLAGPGFWRRFIHPDDFDAVLQHCAEAARRGEDHTLEYRVVTASGELRWVHDQVRVETDAEGRPARLFGVMVDITSRQRGEAALRETQERLRRIIDQAADPLLVHDQDGRFVEVNRRACEVLGYTRDELLSLRVADIEVDRRPGTPDGDGDVVTHSATYRRRDGTTFPVEVRAGRVQWDGRPMMVAIARDMSERNRLEQQLRMSQKMEAVGQLAGGVAHDFNNLLTAIKGHIELLLQETGPGHVVRSDLEAIAKAADRAAELTRQLLAFSRRQIFTPESVDLNGFVESLRPVAERMADGRVRVRTVTAASQPAHVDRAQLEQVLIILISNALEAMSDGGELTIGARDEHVDEDAELRWRHAYVQAGEYVVLYVADTGHGMDAATAARVFEPFYTTRNKGRTAGLGLSTAYGIVKQSDGYIIAESAPDRGTTFHVYLPRQGTRAERPAHEPRSDAEPSTDRLVLVVEDEPAVRSLIGRVLSKRGYVVIEAANGREALERAGESLRPVDLLISDIVMPEMDGPELARRLGETRPGLPVLLISGYSHDAIVREGAFPAGAAFLGKPFTPSELAARVEEILRD